MSDINTDFTDRFDRLEQRLDDSFDKIDQRFEGVDEKFKRIDDKFEKIDGRFERVDEQLDKITVTMIKSFDRIDKELEKKADKVDLNHALDMLDSIIKRQETDQHERLVMGHHLERIERWSHELADKIGHKLVA